MYITSLIIYEYKFNLLDNNGKN